ncbi:MAG: MFS transporter [Lentisphaerae bacterium]|nr:MFS transporter [Lentisphaerota bacterium]
MTYAETLSESVRKKARIHAYLACIFGCISEVMLDNSALIIIYFTMLDGGDMLTMMGTSFTGLMGALLYIPSSIIIARTGLKPMVRYACCTGCAGFLLMAAAPWFGTMLAKYIALIGCFIFCIQRCCYGATWYPMLDVFLRPQDRAGFFGMMRFFYTGFTGILFFILGVILKYDPPLIFMQSVLAASGLLLLGRYFYIAKFPDNLRDAPETPDVKKGLSISMKNGPLTAYSVYLGLFTIAYTSLIPLAYLYFKQFAGLDDGTVQIISSVGIGGLVTGYLLYSGKLGKLKLKYLELFTHCAYIIVALSLFFVDRSLPGFPVFAGAVIFLASLAYSVYMCNNSAELLALARPGNKTVAMAFVQTYSSAGVAIGRLGSSLILGTSLLAPVWESGGREISRYQTFFLFSGVMLLVLLFLLPTLPSFIPAHDDYYEPKK